MFKPIWFIIFKFLVDSLCC